MRALTAVRVFVLAITCMLAAPGSGARAQGFITCEPGTSATIPCPCGNAPSGIGRGCNNSLNTGGASLVGSGNASLGADTFTVFAASIGSSGPTCSSVATNILSVLYQGNTPLAASVPFGDGVLCCGGNVLLMVAKLAQAGTFLYPQVTSDPPISLLSASLGDVLAVGATRCYFVAYRDSCPTFCTTSARNKTSSYVVTWLP